MSATYVTMRTAPRAWVSTTHSPESRPTCEIFVKDASPIDTGLVSADGTPIYRVTIQEPIGFCR